MKKYRVIKKKEYKCSWICVCGRINKKTDIHCVNCGDKLNAYAYVCRKCGFLTNTLPCSYCKTGKFLWECPVCAKENVIFKNRCFYCGYQK